MKQESPAVRRSEPSLGTLLLDGLRQQASPETTFRARVALDISDGEPWTIGIEPDRLSLSAGIAPGSDTTVVTDTATMVAMIEGELSGIQAFIEGRLQVRGNLSLSLRLSGLVGADGRPDRFERVGEVRARGIKTFYLEAGAGPPIILLHGLGATNASMLTTLWELARDHRVIAPDLPGFGESAKPIRSYDASFYAEWAIDFLDKLGIARADFIGNSMGGRVAIEAALCAPERVGRLVLLAPSPAFIKKRQFNRVVRFLRPELALLPVPLPRKQVLRGLKRLFSRSERLEDAWYEAAVDEFIRVFSTPRGRIAFFSAARQIYLEEPHGEIGFWDRLRGLERPALFVWGEKDVIVPAGFARHVERALPTAESVILEDCGHVPQYELPQKTHELVRGFLATG
ncbi:MAG: alpha/beta fold hydrolase [Actinomycetota bacterium]